MSTPFRVVTWLLTAAALALALALLAAPAESHPGHVQKKLFEERWHYQPGSDYETWMNLSTSDVWLDCDGDPVSCGNKWLGPFDASMVDWNAQPMTVRFEYTEGVHDPDFDVNVVIEDEIPGGEGLLGFAPTFDINGDFCFGPCEVYSGIVWIGDDAHSFPYGTANDRRGTLAHELGHIITLAHESTNPSETELYECGMDDTGPIPHSVMAYDCVDPAIIGGAGEYWVQPFDVCGVNHAYFDPAFGFSGCDGSTSTPAPSLSASPTPSPTAPPATAAPTATPSPGQPTISPPQAPTATTTPTAPAASPTPAPGALLVWGDANCSGFSDPIDALLTLRFDAGLSVNRPAGCPEFGAQVQDGVGVASLRLWGDVDCSGAVNPVDSLKVLRRDAGLSVAKSDPACLTIGQGFP